jgi:hypothetical protein
MDFDTLVGRALSWLSTLLPDPPVGTKSYIDKM